MQKIKMEESVIELLESVQPNESKKFPGIENLLLTSKYLAPIIKDRKNLSLFYRFLTIKNSSGHASLCLVHGFGEHSGRLINIAVYFALKGFEVHMIDLRSFGLSTGARCDNNLTDFQYDINLLIQQAREDIPCFL